MRGGERGVELRAHLGGAAGTFDERIDERRHGGILGTLLHAAEETLAIDAVPRGAQRHHRRVSHDACQRIGHARHHQGGRVVIADHRAIPGDGVVVGVVAVALGTAATEGGAGDAHVAVERHVVGSAAELAELRILAAAARHAVVHGLVGRTARLLHAHGGAEDGLAQAGRAGCAEVRAHGCHVEVDVGHGAAQQAIAVAFHPLGAADDAELLGAPRGEDHGARGAVAGTGGLGEAAGALHQDDRPGKRVGGAEAPCVVVAADDHVLVGIHGAGDHAHHVRGAAKRTVLHDLHADLQRVAAIEAVLERQAALPGGVGGHGLALHPAHDLRGSRVADGLHGNARQSRGRHVAARAARRRRLERRGGVTGLLVGEDRSALHAGVVGPSALGPHLALGGAGIGGIREDDQRGGACVLGELGLVAAEVAAVAAEHHLAGAVDAPLLQLGEVRLGAVIGVHDAARHVTGGAVGVPSDREAGMRGGGIFRQVAFHRGQRDHAASAAGRGRRHVGSADDLHERLARLRKRRLELLHGGGEAHGDEGITDAGDLARVAFGAGDVRLAAEEFMPRGNRPRGGHGVQALQRAIDRDELRIARDRRRRCGRSACCEDHRDDGCGDGHGRRPYRGNLPGLPDVAAVVNARRAQPSPPARTPPATGCCRGRGGRCVPHSPGGNPRQARTWRPRPPG